MVCESCLGNARRLTQPFCLICAQPGADGHCRLCQESPPAFDGVRAPYLYDGVIRDAVIALKYRGLRAAVPELGRLLAEHHASGRVPGEIIVPVPLHPRRLRTRGYNQAELLAKEVGKIRGIPVEARLLSRVKDTPAQVRTLTREERATNMGGAFRCVRRVDGAKILLLDDVATTGSTLSACAAALKSAGASSVWGLALAREA